jgi:hypothetical protein
MYLYSSTTTQVSGKEKKKDNCRIPTRSMVTSEIDVPR